MTPPDAASLHIWPQCRSCILGMIQDSLSMASISNNEIRQRIDRYAENVFAAAYPQNWSSPVTANKILTEVRRRSGVCDAYASFKKREVAQARKIFSRLPSPQGGDLRYRIALSVLGNSLDFFTHADDVLQSLPDALQKGISFAYDDIDRLERFLLQKPKRVLFFTDNAGEVFFDIPFFHFIRRHAEHTRLVVKGGPSLNDLSRREVEAEDLESQVGPVADTGTEGVGIDWARTSAAFRNLVRSADLIVSKGMANFETVYPQPVSARVFFLLKAKCTPIQNYLRVPPNSYCAIWKEGGL